MTELYNTESPIDRKRRNNINATWDDILNRFANLQRQINILAGGQEVDELIARLEQAIKAAEIDVQNYIIQVDESVQQAINKNNNALQTALQTVAETLGELNIAISKAETATEDATNAKNATIQATQDAQDAIKAMQSLIDNFSHRGTWSTTTQYYKNNLVEVDGRTYIALKENINTPVTNKSTWALFADKGAQGAEGPRGLPGKDGKDGTGVNIIGGLTSEDELPTVGTPGDAYMIGGNLYVWQDDTGSWKNVGPIQGPEGKSAYDLAVENGFEGTVEEWIESLKGETGPEGPQGPPGQDADLTEVTEQLDQIEQTVDNSWQKGVYNDASITNTGFNKAERTFSITSSDWLSSTNSEVLWLRMPIQSFSGIIKVTYTSYWSNSDPSGGATVVYRIGRYGGGSTTTVNDFVIETITSKFAESYQIRPMNSVADVLAIELGKAPTGSNTMVINVELQGTSIPVKSAFSILEGTTVRFTDSGSPTGFGYPWTPQTTSFMQKSQDNVISGSITSKSTFPFILKPDGMRAHTFHKDAGGTLYIAPTAENGNAEWGLATAFALDGAVHMPKLIVDGVDLKQSVSDGKTKVASAITDKGVSTSPTATFESMANNINVIPTGVKKADFYQFQLPSMNAGQSVTVTTPAMNFEPWNGACNKPGSILNSGYSLDVGVGYIRDNIYVQRMVVNNLGNGNYTVSITFNNGFPTRIDNPQVFLNFYSRF